MVKLLKFITIFVLYCRSRSRSRRSRSRSAPPRRRRSPSDSKSRSRSREDKSRRSRSREDKKRGSSSRDDKKKRSPSRSRGDTKDKRSRSRSRRWVPLLLAFHRCWLSLVATQCCEPKYIAFGSGFRNLSQFGSGSEPCLHSYVFILKKCENWKVFYSIYSFFKN